MRKPKCVLCRKKIELNKDRIYQVKLFAPGDFTCTGKIGIYDAIDCPYCGSQNILSRRVKVVEKNG